MTTLTDRKRFTLSVMMLVLGGMTLAGCDSTPIYTDYEAFIKTPMPVVAGKPYVIEPPDVIQIIAPNAPEIHGMQQKVRPDGFITVYLLGDVMAAGETPEALSLKLEQQILKFYRDVVVQVTVVEFNSKVYYSAGQTIIGPHPYTGRDTVLDAVLRGGTPRTGHLEKVQVLRPSDDGQTVARMTVNCKVMIETGDLRQNAILEEGDIVYIPPTPLAAAGIAMQNLFQPINPIVEATAGPLSVYTGIVTLSGN